MRKKRQLSRIYEREKKPRIYVTNYHNKKTKKTKLKLRQSGSKKYADPV